MSITTVEIGLQERWERQGHTIEYYSMSPEASVLRCSICDREATVMIYPHGGWSTSSRELDQPCR